VFSRGHLVFAGALLLLVPTVAGAVALADAGTWSPGLMALLVALVVGANFVEIEYKRVQISGDFLGVVVAMALLGPAQAAVLAGLSAAVWVVKAPTRAPMAAVHLAASPAYALVGGIVMREVARLLDVGATELGFSVALAAGFVAAGVVNILVTFLSVRVLDGEPFWRGIRTVVVPMLPSEAAMVLLASLIVYAEAWLGPVALGMLVALFFLYLYLYRELVTSQQRAELLGARTEQLASLQVGVLTAMLRTLSMRDKMTARHSAAVARYTRAIAKAAGYSEEQQDLAHTAGLLHDIGKFILPDHILLADSKLADDDWQLIKMHPYQGARAVREVEGYGPIADIIWCHHERIDGRGYPRGLTRDDIPPISRMISIADTYDVMTSRDSYRSPVSSADAIAELRRVSEAQLDGELVEIFIRVLETEDLAFQHTDDEDFESELAFERRVRDYAAPRVLPLPAPAPAPAPDREPVAA
jgi:putative nucleotidyltransferase with HDIG domain